YGPPGAYPGGVTVTTAGEGADVLRRRLEQHLMALGAAAMVGGLVPGIGQRDPGLPIPALTGHVPARIGASDLVMLRGHRENLRTMQRTHGGQAGAAVALTDWASQWLHAEATETTRQELQGELAELYTLTGWCCYDCGALARALYHFARAVELATDAGDVYQSAYALRWAAMMLAEGDRANDALKTAQFAGVRLLDAPRNDPRVAVLGSQCDIVIAFALSRLDDSPSVRAQANGHVAKARDGWEPPDAHAAANMDLVSALTWMHCGQLDTAEAALTMASKTYGTHRRGAVVADLARARLHVLSGDSGAPQLASSALKETARSRSRVVRQIWLPPLVEALESRPGSGYAGLARAARQVATTRV
ncbi:MAG: hypothetical protein ACREX8_00900, partial [Gammaproteobacteria bacterium]